MESVVLVAPGLVISGSLPDLLVLLVLWDGLWVFWHLHRAL